MADEELVVKVTNPVIVDLGGVRSQRIGQLKHGKGPLMDEVMDAVDDVSVSLGPEVKDKILVPVVLVYRRQERRGSLLGFKFPW
jgi:hypothetical protein